MGAAWGAPAAPLTAALSPRSSKPSWADQVEEEGEDGECGRTWGVRGVDASRLR